MSFAVLREVAPPSSVEGAAWARLVAGSPEAYLAVARGSVLDVYRLGAEGADAPPADAPSSAAASPAVRLQAVTSAAFAGNIASVHAVTLAGKAASAVARTHELGGAAAGSVDPEPVQALLVTFAPGKVVVMGLDPFSRSLVTLAMLNFEAGATGPGCALSAPPLETATQVGLAGLAQAAVDPLHRAAAMLVTDDTLAVLPLRRGGIDGGDDEEDEEEDAWPRSSAAPRSSGGGLSAGLQLDTSADGTVLTDEEAAAAAAAVAAQDARTRRVLGQPYLVRLRDVGRRASAAADSAAGILGSDNGASGGGGLEGEVRDLSFLTTYRIEPALGLLVAKGTTSTARLGSLGHNVTFAAVSVDATPGSSSAPAPSAASAFAAPPGTAKQPHHRSPVVMWRYDGLPHDAHTAVPVPEPLGGVVVVSNNALIYLAQYASCGLALNSFAAATVNVKGGAYKLEPQGAPVPGLPAAYTGGGSGGCHALNISAEAGTRLAFLTPHTALLVARDGCAHLLSLHRSPVGGGADVAHMTLVPTRIRGPPMPAGLALLRGGDVDSDVARLRRRLGDAPAATGVEAALAAAAASAAAAAHQQQQHAWSDDPAAPPPPPPASAARFGLLFSCGRVSDSLLSLYALTTPEDAGRVAAGGVAASGAKGGDFGDDGYGTALEAMPAFGTSATAEDDEDAALYGGTAAAGAKGGEAAAADPTAPAPAAVSGAFGSAADGDDEDMLLYGAKPAAVAPATAAAADDLDEDAMLYGTSGAAAAAAAAAPSASDAGADGAAGSEQPTASPSAPGDAAAAAPAGPPLELALYPVDHLPCTGPAAGTALGREAQTVADDADEPPLSAAAPELVVACGVGHAGRVAVTSSSLRPLVTTSMQLPGGAVQGATFVPFDAPPGSSSGNGGCGGGGVLFLSMTSPATGASTRILALDDGGGLAEVPPASTELVTDDATLAAGLVLRHRSAAAGAPSATDGGKLPLSYRLVQVHPGGVRVLTPVAAGGTVTAGPLAQEVLAAFSVDVGGLGAPEGVAVSSADVRDPCVLVRLTDGTVRLLRADEGEGELLVEAPPGPLGGDVTPLPPAAAAARRRPPPFDPVTAACLADASGALGAALGAGGAGGLPVVAVLARRSGAITVHALPSFAALAALSGFTAVPPAEGAPGAARRAALSPVFAGGAHVGSDVLVNTLRGRRGGGGVAAGRISGSAKGASAAAAAASSSAADDGFNFDGGAECLDPAQEAGANGGSSGGDGDVFDYSGLVSGGGGGARKMPRVFVTDVAVTVLPSSSPASTAALLAPVAHLSVVTSSDDVYAYALLPPLAPTASAASSPSATTTSDAPIVAAAFQDAGLPLSYASAAAGLRAARLPGVPGVITRLPQSSAAAAADGADPDADPAVLEAREAMWQAPYHRRLVPLPCVSGWSGLAALTPRPLWLLASRGSVAAVPLGVGDVTGAGGSGGVPGDVLLSVSAGQAPVPALTPFHSPACPHGVLTLVGGHLQFGLLPVPAWPLAAGDGADAASTADVAALVPVRCPFGLLSVTETVVTETAVDGDEQMQTQAHTQEVPPPPAAGAAVLALATGAAAPTPAVALPAHSHPSYGSVHVPLPASPQPLPMAHLPPPAPAGPSAPLALHSLGGATPFAVAYCEGASSRAGATQLREWHAARVARATAEAAASGGKPPPSVMIPPTPSQLECAVLPLYAVAVGVRVPRDHAGDMAALTAIIDAAGGEFWQNDTGAHVELADKAAAALPHDVAAAWGAAGLAQPHAYDNVHEVRLYAGSMHSSAAAAPAAAPQGGGASTPWAAPGGSWAHLASYRLLPGEHVLAMTEVLLGGGGAPGAPAPTPPTPGPGEPPAPAPGNPTKAEPLLVVGTGFVGPRGETNSAAGRLLVFRVETGAPGAPVDGGLAPGFAHGAGTTAGVDPSASVLAHAPRLTLLFTSGELWPKGPVQALAPLASKLPPGVAGGGREVHHLVLAVGRQMQVAEWHPRRPGSNNAAAAEVMAHAAVGLTSTGSSPSGWELRPIGKHDLHSYITGLAVASGYVLAGDAVSGLHFLRWREDDHTLMALARDHHPFTARAVEMVIHDKTLGLAGVDAGGNAGVWHYNPKASGNKLVPAADVATGSRWERGLVRTRAAFPLGTPAASRRRTVLLGGTFAGGALALLPLEEGAFRRLEALQGALASGLPQPGGLHPRAWRLSGAPPSVGLPRAGHVLDGAALARWAALDARSQRVLARSVGLTVDRVSDALRQLELAGAVF